ncbi:MULTISPECIES: hypothetical protein [Photorhabdus]|uniref:hypothetical protein n=1 Tax=Photorhabdus TaxID=29487 RepID=UPI001EEFCB26|nr:hypothetical protein [Photorhabdus khanii]
MPILAHFFPAVITEFLPAYRGFQQGVPACGRLNNRCGVDNRFCGLREEDEMTIAMEHLQDIQLTHVEALPLAQLV